MDDKVRDKLFQKIDELSLNVMELINVAFRSEEIKERHKQLSKLIDISGDLLNIKDEMRFTRCL